MNLSEEQKKNILKNAKQFKVKEISKKLNIPAKEVHNFLKENKTPVPFWFYIFLVAIPLMFFVLVESGLRIFNYGKNVQTWVDVSSDMQILNPEVSYRYFFSTKNIPFSVEAFIKKEKSENSFRIFVLGASSGAGYPYLSAASFSKFLRKKLEILYQDLDIEVCNISMAAINSYTIRNLTPEIIEKNPDLVLIYLGHNEYYGALGVGSLESFGSSRFIVNSTLWLNEFKTVQLLRQIVNSIRGIVSSNEQKSSGTLMSQMAQDKFIHYKSEKFYSGISQFEGNYRDILSFFKDENIPVISGTLVSNLKDQRPFVSVESELYPTADEVYLEAKDEFAKGNSVKAESLFVYAKELDALRFRAPEDINNSIIKISREFNYPIVNVDSLFNYLCNDISGNELLTDHLHPNVKGYQQMGNLFYSAMKFNNLLPASVQSMDESLADSLVYAYYNFTELDSTVADFRIKILKNDWPYINSKFKKSRNQVIHLNTYIDSTALNIIDGLISREKARLNVANYYLQNKDYNKYSVEMHALIEEFPFINKYFSISAKELIKAGKISLAYPFLQSGFNKEPDAFLTKWLGIINISQGNVDEAIYFLEISLKFNNQDAQTHYNIAGAYAEKKEFAKALDAIKKCLHLNPKFSQAENIKHQLENILRDKR